MLLVIIIKKKKKRVAHINREADVFPQSKISPPLNESMKLASTQLNILKLAYNFFQRDCGIPASKLSVSYKNRTSFPR